MIEKRLKQGLTFPDPDYNSLLDSNHHQINTNNHIKSSHKLSNNENNSNHNNASLNSNTNTPTAQYTSLHTPNLSNNNVILTTTNNANGLTKQNSQLLPKRHHVQVAARSSSQKNVDFKSIFNNMNLNNSNRITYNNNRDTDQINSNNNDSNSPSPDFIAAAMSPAKNNNQHGNNNSNNNVQQASASSIRTSRQTNYQDLVNRKQNGSNSSINNASNTNIDKISATQSRVSATSYGGSQTDYKIDRYYVPNPMNNRMSPADEPYQPLVYFQPTDNRTNLSSNLSNATPTAIKNGQNGSIRSLPSSLYRGSPERSLPRSPERQHHDYLTNNINANNNYRPTTSRISSRPSDASEKSYDVGNQKYKVANYLSAKRSLTSDEKPNTNNLSSAAANIVKNRQLHMGKAKIDLDTQPSNFKYFK